MSDHSPINQPEAEPGTPAPPDAPALDPQAPLPAIPTPLDEDEIRDRLTRAARRGDLPGYHASPPAAPSAGPLFTVTDFGIPFESRLVARREGEAITFELKLKPLFPAIFIALLIFTVWPGVWFTESMLETYLPDTWITTWVWWWYLILTVPFLPWAMWAAVKKSRITARQDAEKLLQRIQAALNDEST